MISRRRPQGQTLLLFALTLLLLTLMVIMTIGIGARIHERQEQQVVADAAAYSQAVLTARTFNSISSMNRVLVAEMSSIAAAQSLLSWTVFYHGVLNQARDVVAALKGKCPSPYWDAAYARICAEDNRLIEIFEPQGSYEGIENQDPTAANYIRHDLYETAILISEDQQRLYQYMKTQIVPAGDRPRLAENLAEQARLGSPWRDSPNEIYAGRQSVTKRELDDVVAKNERGDREIQDRPRDMVQVVMATRGVENFTSARQWTSETDGADASAYLARRLNKVMDSTVLVPGPSPIPITITISHFGTSYFSNHGPERLPPGGVGERRGLDGDPINRGLWTRYYDDLHNAPENFRPWGAWGQDVGLFRFSEPGGCDVAQPGDDSFGYLVSTHRDDDHDNHMWRRGQSFDYREWGSSSRGAVPRQFWPDKRHTFDVPLDTGNDPDTGRPSIWPAYVDFNSRLLDTNSPKANAYGAPKSLVSIRRDYGSRSFNDPWELRFRFDFARDGQQGTLMNLRDQRAEQSGISLRRSTAIGSGITYYHRGPGTAGANDHTKEPPNFLNPFWRATLTASDVDERFANRGDDVERTLRNDLNEPDQARALRYLIDEGFEAVP